MIKALEALQHRQDEEGRDPHPKVGCDVYIMESRHADSVTEDA